MNTKRSVVHSAAAAFIFGLLAACSSSSSTESSASQALGGLNAAPRQTRVHVMPTRPQGTRDRATAHASTAQGPSGAQLTYYGGKVISNVQVTAVYWGPKVQLTSALEGFYPAFTGSSVMDLLAEYATSTQTIGHGSYAGSIVDATPPAGTTIDDAQIQTELDRLITNGQLPANDGNKLFMVHFPPGVTITQGGQRSCSAFCGYHGTFMSNAGGGEVYYGVIPDLGGACASACGSATEQDNLTTVTSHEVSEAITDAEVGLGGSSIGAPLAWYDANNGEIGDICAWTGQSTVQGFAVQLEWSNAQGLCASAPGGGAPPPPPPPPSDAGAPDSAPPPPPPPPPSNACDHPVCAAGASLAAGCDPCATQVCQQDGYCCATAWDAQCVGEVGSICGQACP